MAHRFLVIVGSVFSLGLFGQSSDRYQFKQLTEENGLPGVTTRCVFQDSKGLLWIGVESTGLCKYDGYNFSLFESVMNDSLSLCNNVVEAISEDEEGNIWVGTQNGLSVLDKNKQEFRSVFKGTSTLPGNVVYDILRTRGNAMYLATDGGVAVARDNGRIFSAVSLCDTVADLVCYDLFEAFDGYVWAGTNHGLFKLNDRGVVVQQWHGGSRNGFPAGNVYSISQDTEGNMWIGCELVLLKLDKSGQPFNRVSFMPRKTVLGGAYICKIQLDKRGKLWIGTASEGLSVLDPKTGSYEYIIPAQNKDGALRSSSVRDIMEDRAGNIWLALKFSGLQYFNPNRLLFQYVGIDFAENDVFPSKSIISLYEGSGNEILLGTNKSGLQLFDRKTKSSAAFCAKSSVLSQTRINDICEDARRTLWLATPLGAYSCQRETKKEQGWPIGNVVAVVPDHSSTIWAGTTNGLFFKKPGDKAFIQFAAGREAGFDHNANIKVLFEDRGGNLWVGTLQNGLYKISRNRESVTFYQHSASDSASISGDLIRFVFEDRKGNIWISTRGQGLNLFVPSSNTFRHYLEKDGLPSNTLFGILEDGAGNLWLSSYKGIGRFNPSTGQTERFTKEFGLQDDVFEPQATLLSHDGEIFFGGGNGFNHFMPEKVKKTKANFPLIITSIKIFNETYAADVTAPISLTLPWDKNYITFDFSLLDFASRQGITYEYQLKGIDNQPVKVENRHSTTYTNIEPGTYVFSLDAYTKDGVKNSNNVQVYITINPPFWRRMWFQVFVSLLVVSVIYLVFRLRLNSIKKRNAQLERMVRERTIFLELQKEELSMQKKEYQQQSEELAIANKRLQQSNNTKDRLFSVISHDLKNPFNTILGFSENILAKYYLLDDQKKYQYLTYIQTASKSVYALLENLLNWYKTQSGSFKANIVNVKLREEIDAVINEYALAAFEKQIVITSAIPPQLRLDTDREMLSTVFRNLVNNALKFTPVNGQVSISSDVFKDRIDISVTDNGEGMSEHELESLFLSSPQANKPMKKGSGTGLGLQICKELVDLLQGVIEVKSTEGGGTTFTISLPYNYCNIKPRQETPGDEVTDTWLKELSNVDSIIEADKKSLLNKRILVVDDNQAILEHLAELLSPVYKVSVSDNGTDALEIAQKELPDLIITDLMMPGLNGFELTTRLKSTKSTQYIPVVLITAQNAESIIISAYNFGVSDFIAKPFNDRIVQLKVRNVLMLKESMRVKMEIEDTVASIPNIPANEDVFMVKLFDTICAHIDDPEFDVEKLSYEMNMSKSTLMRKLHQFTGKNPWEIIVEIRFEKSKELLKMEKYSISEVAWAVGFSDVKYFSRKFKELYGYTPKQYTKR